MSYPQSPLKKIIVILVALLLVTAAAAKPLVVVTLPDLAGLVQAVTGDEVELQVVMPAGADPHSFSVTADLLRQLRRADLLVYAHSGFMHFEEHLVEALGPVPALDWPDYERHGARLLDIPGYAPNTHGFWLDLHNARALTAALAERLPQLGLPAAVVAARAAMLDRELAAQQQLGRRLATQSGLSGKPLAAMIPGVAYCVSNLGLQVGAVLMAEGSGFGESTTLAAATRDLRSGALGGLVCPLSLAETRIGEAARQLARDTGTVVYYVRFLDLDPNRESFLSLTAFNLAAIGGGAGTSLDKPLNPQSQTPAKRSLAPLAVTVIAILIGALGFGLGYLLARRRHPEALCGAGLFDPRPPSPESQNPPGSGSCNCKH